MQDVAERLDAHVETIGFLLGSPFMTELVEKKVKEKYFKIIAIIHAGTSTGVRNPVDEIGYILENTKCIYLVDTVNSLGGMEIIIADWRIDALFSETQKCISCPP